METSAGKVISTILKHDKKVTSYKIALLRAINDVVLSYPDVGNLDTDIAIPLRTLAKFWLAYYWPFFDDDHIILQGPRAVRRGKLTNDMAFRHELAVFRSEWNQLVGGRGHPADGFYIINELMLQRMRKSYPNNLLRLYDLALQKISNTIKMPIRYAGPGEWSVFGKPEKYLGLQNRCTALPGTQLREECVVVNNELWNGFQEMSFYVEALCIHEWSLFTEQKNHSVNSKYDRGFIYSLLTERPDNRRPLTWERNQVDILLIEGKIFKCPWTEKKIQSNIKYDMDHLIPVSLYPINELWNLVPTDPYFNSHKKKDRLPRRERLTTAEPHLRLAYQNYLSLQNTAQAIMEDVKYRFFSLKSESVTFPNDLAYSVINYIDQLAIA